MPGYRLVHRTARSCVVTVPDLTRPYPTLRPPCPTCQVVHPVKTYHLLLDDAGTVIVSEGVLRGLRRAGLRELRIDVKVPHPAIQHLDVSPNGIRSRPQRPRIITYGA